MVQVLNEVVRVITQPTVEEVEQLKINYERGFYVEFRDGKLYAGKYPEFIEGITVYRV